MSYHPPLRLTQTTLAALTALYMTLVVFGNVTVYHINFDFVSTIISMKGIPPEVAPWRSIQPIWAAHLFYIGIIAVEATVAALAWLGVVRMWRARAQEAAVFGHAKAYAVYALLLGIVLWFGAFVTVGGEWFYMWLSPANGQPTAFSLCTVFALFLLVELKEER